MAVSFTNNSKLFITLKQKVDLYFKENNLKPTGNIHLYTKTAVLFSLVAITYSLILFASLTPFLNATLWGFMGLVFSGIGFGVMHDGAHGSYSDKKWVNDFMGNALHLLGGSTYLWKAKHNINHHSFTNIDGVDDDIDVKPWLRIHPDQPKHKFHRFQHIYWMGLYGLTYITWIYWRDFDKYFKKEISGIPFKKMKTKDHIEFWAWKVIYTIIFLVIPMFKIGVGPTLIGYATLCFVCGLAISVVFQLAHVVEESSFPVPDENNKIQEDWVVHQINTTANFATHNKLVSWYVGGLNFQVEHHIFPRISHVHYPAISKLLQETCQQFNVKYREMPTVFHAVRSHARYLKALGRE